MLTHDLIATAIGLACGLLGGLPLFYSLGRRAGVAVAAHRYQRLIVGSGFAVFGANDQADLCTVGEHERASKVNWLWNEGYRVTQAWSDEQIAQTFASAALRRGVRVLPVHLVEVPCDHPSAALKLDGTCAICHAPVGRVVELELDGARVALGQPCSTYKSRARCGHRKEDHGHG